MAVRRTLAATRPDKTNTSETDRVHIELDADQTVMFPGSLFRERD